MKLELAMCAALAVFIARPAAQEANEGSQWKPFQFKGNERYEFKLVMDEGGSEKETGFGLDIRKKADDESFDVTWSIKSNLRKEELNEQTMLVGWASAAPAYVMMNPMYAMFVNDLELKEGAKLSVLGAMTVKVTGKETVGGRTGFICQLLQKAGDQETLAWQWTVDPELALPIKSLVYSGDQVSARAELTSYKKD